MFVRNCITKKMEQLQYSREEQFTQAANDWDLERLYKDLAEAKTDYAPYKKKGLTEVEKQYLRGLLCGYSSQQIADKLYKSARGIDGTLCVTIYRYVENLTNKSINTLKNWRDISHWLEEAEYKIRSSNSVENKPEIIPSVSESAEDFNKLGIKKAEEGDFEGALENFDRAIKLNPDYADAYNNRASVRHELGDDPGAQKDYTEAILLNPDRAVYHDNLGIISYSSDDYRGAQAAHTRSIQLNGGAQAYNNRGFARLRLAEVQAALKDFTQAIELNPNDALAWNNRGDVYLESGNLERALEDYAQAARLNPKNPKTFYYLGVIHSRLGNKEKALEDFTKAIELEREFAEAYQNRGIVHYELGYSQKADVDFHNAKNLYRRHGKEENYQKLLDIIEGLQQED